MCKVFLAKGLNCCIRQAGNTNFFSGVSLAPILWECLPFIVNVVQLLTSVTCCHLVLQHALLATALNRKETQVWLARKSAKEQRTLSCGKLDI